VQLVILAAYTEDETMAKQIEIFMKYHAERMKNMNPRPTDTVVIRMESTVDDLIANLHRLKG
jgi:ribosome-interacting GTPase 1